MRRLIALIILFSLCFSTASCTSAEPSETTEVSSDKSVTLDVVTCYAMDDGNSKNYEAAVALYEQKTGNKVQNRIGLSNDDWKTRVVMDFITGSEPDVLFYFSNADATHFVNAGKVVSIEEIREQYPDYATNMKQTMMAVSDDGKHYAVPATGFWETMFVNKAVLEDCGLEIPGPDYTWEQFLQDCATIKQAGYTPIACSLFDVPHYWFEFMVMNNGTVENHLEVPTLDDSGNLIDNAVAQKWISALEDIKDLYDKGYFPDNTLTATDAETVGMFADGDAAFLIDGSWKVGYFTKNYSEKLEDYVVSFVPGKGKRLATDTVGGISMGYFITRKAWENPEKQKAAVDFVSCMTSEKVIRMFVTTELTALINEVQPAGLNVLQQSAADAGTHVTGASQAVQDKISNSVKSELFSCIPKVVTEQMSAAEAIESAMRMD